MTGTTPLTRETCPTVSVYAAGVADTFYHYRVICPTANSIAHITRHIIPMKNKYMPIVGAGDGTGNTHRNIPMMINTIARTRRGCNSLASLHRRL